MVVTIANRIVGVPPELVEELWVAVVSLEVHFATKYS